MANYVIGRPGPNAWHTAAETMGQIWEQQQEKKRQEELRQQQEAEIERQRREQMNLLAIKALSPQDQYQAAQEHGAGTFDPSKYSPAAPQRTPEQQFDDMIYTGLIEGVKAGTIAPEIIAQAQAKRAAGQPLTDFVYALSQTPEEQKPVAVGVKTGQIPDADTITTQENQNIRQERGFQHDRSMESTRQANRKEIEQIKGSLSGRDKEVFKAQIDAIDDRIRQAERDVTRFQSTKDIEKVNIAKEALRRLLAEQDKLIQQYGGGGLSVSAEDNPLGL